MLLATTAILTAITASVGCLRTKVAMARRLKASKSSKPPLSARCGARADGSQCVGLELRPAGGGFRGDSLCFFQASPFPEISISLSAVRLPFAIAIKGQTNGIDKQRFSRSLNCSSKPCKPFPLPLLRGSSNAPLKASAERHPPRFEACLPLSMLQFVQVAEAAVKVLLFSNSMTLKPLGMLAPDKKSFSSVSSPILA